MGVNFIDSHSQIALSQWRRLESLLTGTVHSTTSSLHSVGEDDDVGGTIRLDGKSLDVASIVAVSRFVFFCTWKNLKAMRREKQA